MMEKRRKAISSYKSASLLHGLTLQQARKIFPAKTQALLSPKSRAITDREALMCQLKSDTLYEANTKNQKKFRAAPPTLFFKPELNGGFSHTSKQKHSRQDTLREQIQKSKNNLVGYGKYALDLRERLRGGQRTNTPRVRNEIRKNELEGEPDGKLIAQLVDDENFQYESSRQPLDTHRRSSSQRNYHTLLHLSAQPPPVPAPPATLRYSKLRKMDVDTVLLKALSDLQSASQQLRKHTQQCLQGWQRTAAFSSKDNQKRAEIVYLARWNEILSRVIAKYRLDKHQDKLLKLYYGINDRNEGEGEVNKKPRYAWDVGRWRELRDKQ